MDPEEEDDSAGGGALWGDVDHAGARVRSGHAERHHLDDGCRRSDTRAEASVTLRGKCGLTIDNLLAVDMVLADGTFVTASAKENRGSLLGGPRRRRQFRRRHSFLFRAAPDSPRLRRSDALAARGQGRGDALVSPVHHEGAPTTSTGFSPLSPCRPVRRSQSLSTSRRCAASCGATPALQEGGEGVGADPRVQAAGTRPGRPAAHPALQSMFDALYPPGLQWYWKADFVHELSDEAIARHLEHGSRPPTMLSTMHLYPINGAAARVKNKATAWAIAKRTGPR